MGTLAAISLLCLVSQVPAGTYSIVSAEFDTNYVSDGGSLTKSGNSVTAGTNRTVRATPTAQNVTAIPLYQGSFTWVVQYVSNDGNPPITGNFRLYTDGYKYSEIKVLGYYGTGGVIGGNVDQNEFSNALVAGWVTNQYSKFVNLAYPATYATGSQTTAAGPTCPIGQDSWYTVAPNTYRTQITTAVVGSDSLTARASASQGSAVVEATTKRSIRFRLGLDNGTIF